MTEDETAPLYPFPEELLRLPRDASAVIEASAGTGKTYLLEHLVLDRVIRGEARLEDILVVTFTEKATAELVRRVRALVRRLLDHRSAAGPGTSEGAAWRIDAAVRGRLEEAWRAFDRATICTIHAFCQGVLTEQAFAGGRLLAQQHVESRGVFSAAFADTLRRTLSTDPAYAPYLQAWLLDRGDVDQLEALLYKLRGLRAPLGMRFDAGGLAAAAQAFAALPLAALRAEGERCIKHSGTRTAFFARVARLHGACDAFVQHRNVTTLLVELDRLFDSHQSRDLYSYIERNGQAAPLAPLLLATVALAEAAVPLELAVADLFLPVVNGRLDQRKRAAGLFDFDDMLAEVAIALRGPGGPALIAVLRARYRLAVIDEFQDTDPIQWEIFRAVFHDSGGKNPLYVIGDPKQSIYGFRGADVQTYLAARDQIAGTEATVHLARNFRSTGAVIDAYNALLDQEASEPFFSTGTVYRPPVICGRMEAAGSSRGAPLKLLRVTAVEEVERLLMRQARASLTQRIAEEVERRLAGPDALAASDIFVLTRTRAEANAVAAALHARGLPHALYDQEGLYVTDEARHVRDLLSAIADPHDPRKRLRAWLTPFFALSLGDLPAAAAVEGGHPLLERLFSWRALAESHDYGHLFDRILDDSGVVRRELFQMGAGGGSRRLTNYAHLFERILADLSCAPQTLGEMVRRMTALIEELVVPAAEEGNVQRLAAEGPAVQIMTMHKAKGLEAEVVFLYGGFTAVGGRGPRSYAADGRRLAFAGRPRREGLTELIMRERDGDDQRLLYVALTRARRELVLPYSGEVPEEEAGLETAGREEYWKLNGGYRHVNQRLRALAADPAARRHIQSADVPCPPVDAADDRAADAARALRDWRPDPSQLAPVGGGDPLGALRRGHAGVTVTSYTRIKQAHGGYQPPTEILDEPAPLPGALEPAAAAVTAGAGAGPDGDELPGGPRSGIFLHAVLESLPLDALAAAPSFEDWAARPAVRALFETTMRRYDREPRHLASAERLAHAALTTPLPVRGGAVSCAAAGRVAREVEFLYPFPAAAGGPDRGFVKGFVDLIFEHQGLVYFGDWKTDLLPAWDSATLAGHVAANYDLQVQLYALALVRMLAITDRDSYEARFGGLVYVFVRGLPAALHAQRPSWDDILRWQDALGDRLGGDREAAP